MKPNSDEKKPSKPKPNPELVENWPDEKLFDYSAQDLLSLEKEYPDAVFDIRAEQLRRGGVPWETARVELKKIILRQQGAERKPVE